MKEKVYQREREREREKARGRRGLCLRARGKRREKTERCTNCGEKNNRRMKKSRVYAENKEEEKSERDSR